ncbi:hypothetical protein J6590_011022 [Homalodisca vitripennis]|nr:hypothetical protein J6590_011022 [Homalodisca vitripennis]
MAMVCQCRLRHRSHTVMCGRCAPGWGVVRPCTPLSHTVCAPCAAGHYSPHHSYRAPCWLCSHCGPGLYEAHPCTPITDTVCDSCLRLQLLNASKHCP